MWSCEKNRPRTIVNASLMRHWAIWLVLWGPAVLLWSSCSGCAESPLATLANARGTVERDFAPSMRQWQPAEKGATFRLNDGIRTRAQSEAELWLRDGSGLRMLQNSFIRFSKTPPGEKRVGLKIEEGVILIDAVTDNLEINTRYGVAIVKKGTRIKLTRGKDGVELEVQIGRARFVKGEQTTELIAGQRIQVTVGQAVLLTDTDFGEIPPSDAGDSDAVEELENPDGSATMADTGETLTERGDPLRSDQSFRRDEETTVLMPDILLSAGESPWIHTVRAPVNIAFSTRGLCQKGGVLKHGRKNYPFAADHPAVFSATPGHSRYFIHCANDAPKNPRHEDAEGRVHIILDRGKIRLVHTPPVSTVLMDGRTYSVYYQSRLPTIRVKWPTAPEGSRFTLRVNGDDSKTLGLSAPQHTFASGDLKEGTLQFTFFEENSGARSRCTTLKILFDNVSEKANLVEPAEGSFENGSTVSVRGIAMVGWQVSVPTGKVTMTGSGRFEGTVHHQNGYRAIWLRLSHPGRGVHYYIRRARTQ
jgi:hypothetical protein